MVRNKIVRQRKIAPQIVAYKRNIHGFLPRAPVQTYSGKMEFNMSQTKKNWIANEWMEIDQVELNQRIAVF